MRNTKQRGLVLEVVSHSYSHPTASHVYQECIKVMPNISLGTVYRNLSSLVEQGKIQRLENSDHIACYDRVAYHDHFICIKCGKIIDIKRKNVSYDKVIDGNKVLDYSIRYSGVCCDCMKVEEESRKYGIKGK